MNGCQESKKRSRCYRGYNRENDSELFVLYGKVLENFGYDETEEVVVEEDDNGDYWAYWDCEKEEFRNIYDCELKVRTCDHNMYRIKEEKGKGKVMKVSVTSVGD